MRDYEQADRLRNELRAKGIEPDRAMNERRRTGGPVREIPKYDEAIEQKLDMWVELKKSRDWERADALRNELRNYGVDPNLARPPPVRTEGGGARFESQANHQAMMMPIAPPVTLHPIAAQNGGAAAAGAAAAGTAAPAGRQGPVIFLVPNTEETIAAAPPGLVLVPEATAAPAAAAPVPTPPAGPPPKGHGPIESPAGLVLAPPPALPPLPEPAPSPAAAPEAAEAAAADPTGAPPAS